MSQKEVFSLKWLLQVLGGWYRQFDSHTVNYSPLTFGYQFKEYKICLIDQTFIAIHNLNKENIEVCPAERLTKIDMTIVGENVERKILIFFCLS